MNKRYEQLFIVLGVLTTIVLACTAFILWVKHSLKFVVNDIDDIFGEDIPEACTPEVVCTDAEDEEDDDTCV